MKLPEFVFPEKRKGVALIPVLMLVALMVIMVVGLFIVVREERTRSRSYLEVGRSQLLIDVATQEVLAKIMDGSMVPYSSGKARASYTAAPGVIEMRHYDLPLNKGYQKWGRVWKDKNAYGRNPFAREYEFSGKGDWRPANPLTIPLYSQRWFAPGIRYLTAHNGNVRDGNPDYNPARMFNINTSQNPFYPAELYLSGAPDEAIAVKDIYTRDEKRTTRRDLPKLRFKPGELASDRPVHVQWLPIYRNAAHGPEYVDENGKTRRNPIVGRYAYWVDVENTKVNIRVADRRFDDTMLGALLGVSEAENPNRGDWRADYFQQNINVTDKKLGSGPAIRALIESSQMNRLHPNKLTSGTTLDGTRGIGTNQAAIFYHQLWFDWNERGEIPYCADNSLIDWKAFTGVRPWAGGTGETTTVEGLLSAAATDYDTHFNTFSEVYSLLDPLVERIKPFKGRTALTAMRRTYGNSVTIYGYDDERDPLGRAKIDLVAFQREGIQNGQNLESGRLWNELLTRLEDPDYYKAYYPDAYPTKGRPISFVESLNPLVGDNNPNNMRNGRLAAKQMMVNLVEYAKPHHTRPFLNEEEGIVGAKSMPYVTEVATRGRNGLWRLFDDANGGDEFSEVFTLLREPFEAVGLTPETDLGGIPREQFEQMNETELDQKIREFLEWQSREGYPVDYYLRNVTIDLTTALMNPNPFASPDDPEQPNSRRNNRFEGELTLKYRWDWPPSPLTAEGLPEFPPVDQAFYPDTYDSEEKTGTKSDSPSGEPYETQSEIFEGLYAARPLGVPRTNTIKYHGVRAGGRSVYFDLGMVPGMRMNHPSQVTCFQVVGWDIKDREGNLFHRVPLRHPGQFKRPNEWWEMAQRDHNPGQMFEGEDKNKRGTVADEVDYHSLAQYWKPYSVASYRHGNRRKVDLAKFRIPNLPRNSHTQGPVSVPKAWLPWKEPLTAQMDYANWSHVAVGWFTARTIAEYTAYPASSKGDEVPDGRDDGTAAEKSGQGWSYWSKGLEDYLFIGNQQWKRLKRDLMPPDRRGQKAADEMQAKLERIKDKLKALRWILRFAEANRDRDALVERVVCIDPTLGHRTGNPDAGPRADGHWPHVTGSGRYTLRSRDVGHFYGTNGHPWRHYLYFKPKNVKDPNQGGMVAANPEPSSVFEWQAASPMFLMPSLRMAVGIHFAAVSRNYDVPIGNTTKQIKETVEPEIPPEDKDKDPKKPTPGKKKPPKNVSAGPPEPPPPPKGGNGQIDLCLTLNFSNPRREAVNQQSISGPIVYDSNLFRRQPKGRNFSYYRRDVEAPQVAAMGNNTSNTQGMRCMIASAPKGDYMVSIGEIGFVHSGLLQRPIDLTGNARPGNVLEGQGPLSGEPANVRGVVSAPRNGPPMHMLLDLFTPGAFRDNLTSEPHTEQEWRSGQYKANSPTNPRRGTWNVNSLPASDSYLAVREGAPTKNGNPSWRKIHPIWAPNANGFGRELKVRRNRNDQFRLDPMMSPFPRYRRGIDGWISVVGGDFTPYRSRGEGLWGEDHLAGAYDLISAPRFTWRAGKGSSSGGNFLNDIYVNFDPEVGGSSSKLLAMGRTKKFRNNNEKGYFENLVVWCADQNYPPQDYPGRPLEKVGRFANLPLRHHNSEIITLSTRKVNGIYTALNPRHASVGWQGRTRGFHKREDGQQMLPGNSHAGGFALNGIYANAPVALMANQVSTSANVFTIHIVTQALRDNGREREDLHTPKENTNSGVGYMDADDEVVGEQWAQVVVGRLPAGGTDPVTGGPKYDYRLLYSRIMDNPK